MPLSLFLFQGLLAALLFYILVGQHQRQPLWNMLTFLVAGMVPPLNWVLLLVCVGLRLWRQPSPAVTAKN
ncbi:hypothetical protein [Pseudidiomarina taiwanensis]|uniref:Uncharacterized protein n=1 Tax=Pseudidiomarina taiwanensis TaxID=337250 RepID=A0A432ZL96_9GAMM|nr:hypothetical protein [Pseudidiomarina taiwanensis]RUO78693.1 hypothetical protein CWI83_06650 [Pseudidiomarina taiwanensis]